MLGWPQNERECIRKTLFLHKPQNTDLSPRDSTAKQIKNYFYGNVLENNREKN